MVGLRIRHNVTYLQVGRLSGGGGGEFRPDSDIMSASSPTRIPPPGGGWKGENSATRRHCTPSATETLISCGTFRATRQEQTQHGAVPALGPDPAGALGVGKGRECFWIITAAGPRHQNREIHGSQHRDVIGTVTEADRTNPATLGSPKPGGQSPYRSPLVVCAHDV